MGDTLDSPCPVQALLTVVRVMCLRLDGSHQQLTTPVAAENRKGIIMNIFIISGRLTNSPEVRISGNTSRARFNLAVDRAVARDESGNRPTDFPSFVAFGKNAELLGEYAVKGQLLEVTGRIATSTYDKDGERQYNTDLIVDRVQLGAKPRGTNTEPSDPDPESHVATVEVGEYEEVF